MKVKMKEDEVDEDENGNEEEEEERSRGSLGAGSAPQGANEGGVKGSTAPPIFSVGHLAEQPGTRLVRGTPPQPPSEPVYTLRVAVTTLLSR